MPDDMAFDKSVLNLELSRDKLKRQDESIRLITTKAGILFAACVLIVSDIDTINPWVIIPIVLAGVLALFTIWPRDYNDGPDVERAKEIMDEHEYQDSIEWIAEACTLSAKTNAPKISRNAYALNIGMGLLGLGIILNIILN